MKIFHTRDLCLRALDTNSRNFSSFDATKSVRRNGDYYEQRIRSKKFMQNICD